MDPVAALGLVANVMNFVEYAQVLVSKGYKFYKAAGDDHVEYKDLILASDRLSKLSSGLTETTKTLLPGPSQGASVRTQQLYTHSNALIEITGECARQARDFHNALQHLTEGGGQHVWKSFRQAFKLVWSKGDIDDKFARLKELQEQVVIHLLVVISHRQVDDFAKQVEQTDRMEGVILDAIEHSTKSLLSQLENVVNFLTRSNPQPLDVWRTANQDVINQAMLGMSQRIAAGKKTLARDILLDSLHFSQINERRLQVIDAHSATFRWIFKEPPSDPSCTWSDFTAWLANQSPQVGLYWISGKPGSGKSTLMRFLHDSPHTRDCLEKWSESKPLMLANCFFWNPGTDLQRSYVGLLRSLLYELLQQAPELMPEVVPHRWRATLLSGSLPSVWSGGELAEAFQKVIEVTAETHRICFFIDGLDEFEGNDDQRLSLIKLLTALSQSSSVKVCVSSRPWVIFKDSFADNPSMLLEHLTRDDIRNYVDEELSSNGYFRELATSHDGECEQIKKEICSRAQGVFLWVALVVQSLISCLRDGATILELLQRLAEIPDDLDNFFRQMIKTITPRYRSQATTLFKVALGTQSDIPLTLMTLSFTMDWPNLPNSLTITKAEAEARLNRMDRRLNSRCKGMLEVQTSSGHGLFFTHTVEFLHRTVRDFLVMDETQKSLHEFADRTFNVTAFLAQSILSQLKMVKTRDEYSFLRLTNECLIYATEAEADNQMAIAKLLDELSVVIEPHRSALKRSGFTNSDMIHREPNILVETWGSWDSWKASVLTLAIQYGIQEYSIDSIKNRLKTVSLSEGRPMLDFALRRVIGTELEPRAPNKGVVEALLKRGADPNMGFESKTIWVHYVGYVRRRVSHPSAAWAEAAALLIRHGATRWTTKLGRTKMEDVLLDGQMESISHVTANQIDMTTRMESTFGTEWGQALAEMLRTGTPRRLSVWRQLGRKISPKREKS